MHYDFALDLKVARRKMGLTQIDLAHLMGVGPTRISKLEAGKTQPTVIELCILCLVLGRPADTLCQEVVLSLRQPLSERLASMPEAPEAWRGLDNRTTTLNALASRLKALTQTQDAA